MASYSASGNQNLDSSDISALTVAANAGTPHRNKITEILFGNVGTPDDQVVLYTVQRCTVLGTNTLVTASLDDLAERAAQALCGENHTVEPTYTANQEVLEVPANTRATFRWVAPPEGEIITPATAASGLGVHSIHASVTTEFRIGMRWKE